MFHHTVMNKRTYCKVLTIAGSDSGGGAGIQADIKTIEANNCFATSVITAITVQNTLGVQAVYPVDAEVVVQQAKAVLEDIGADAIKIGMLCHAEIVRRVSELLATYSVRNVVLDTVLASTSGCKMLDDEAIDVLKEVLIPSVRVITPNLPEAEILLGEPILNDQSMSNDFSISDDSSFGDYAKRLSFGRKVSVYLKGGHLKGSKLCDWFYNAETDELIKMESDRIDTVNTHGTGCTLSSALAAGLAQGRSLNEAAKAAHRYVHRVIQTGADFSIGEGHGPLNHFFR